MYDYEKALIKAGYKLIAGVDEVGRGPLAGGVLAAAVILDPHNMINGLNDSKQLSKKKRTVLETEIKQKALAYAYGYVSQSLIDQINIYQASKLAMVRAIKNLKIKPEFILSDAMPLNTQDLPFLAIIKGDTLSATIAAASIIAKEKRDEIMERFSKIYPLYEFDKHKGYPTPTHLEKLQEFGVSPLHRKTYKPIKDLMIKQLAMEGLDEV